MPGLIFDCDGVLVDSETALQLNAFNEVWREQGIPWRWSRDEYTRLTKISGGKERLESLYDDVAFRTVFRVPEDRAAFKQIVSAWHRRKTEIYVENVRRGCLTARPGVKRLAEEALERGWRLGVASSGAPEAVLAVIKSVIGPQLTEKFVILSGEVVARKKPAPDIYIAMARALQLRPEACIAIEDTVNGMVSACAAGMHCIVTPTSATAHFSFPQAVWVISCLGDPGGQVMKPLSAPVNFERSWLTIDDLGGLVLKSTSHRSQFASTDGRRSNSP